MLSRKAQPSTTSHDSLGLLLRQAGLEVITARLHGAQTDSPDSARPKLISFPPMVVCFGGLARRAGGSNSQTTNSGVPELYEGLNNNICIYEQG